MVLAWVRRGATISKSSTFQIFPNFGRGGGGGGGIENQFFPKFKKVQIILGEGGGSRKLWTFSTNYGIFYFEPSPIRLILLDITP